MNGGTIMKRGIEDISKSKQVNLSALTDKPLRWHMFLIYFSLFFGMLYAIYQGFGLLSGTIYTAQGLSPSSFYAFFPNAKVVDVLFGILFIALAVYMFVVRQRLSRRKASGPTGLLALLVIQIMLGILYRLFIYATVKAPFSLFIDMELVINLLVGVPFIIINRIYYRKRSHLFVD